MSKKKLLVIVDPTSDRQPAVDRAAALAERLPASLELFICHYDPDIAAGRYSTVWIEQPAQEKLMAILENRIQDLAEPLRRRGLEATTDVVWDRPLDEGIVRKILAVDPWMVVKDTHHHNVLKRTVLSNTDWGLIRHCPVPLLLVKLDPASTPAKICAAVDPAHEHDKPAELDTELLRLARYLADATDAQLQVVHTYAVKAEPVGLEAPAIGKFADAIRDESARIFKVFLKNNAVPAEQAHLLEGLAHERLVDFAIRQGIGTMIMGAISRGVVGQIFIGSTAERALDRLPCDLLIVKPPRVAAALRELA